MEAAERATKERILVFDEKRADLERTCAALAHQLPFAEVEGVASLVDYHAATQGREYDVVIIEQQLEEVSGVELMVELKLRDREPAVLLLSRSADPKVLSSIYSAGNSRCIVKEGRWLEEIGPAVRHLLRIRKLEHENAALIAKLTEANVLLSEKNKRLDEFSGTVAHDIRGPLGGINMKLEYMCDVYREEVDERLGKLLSSTFESSKRLLGVVQAMYEFAKLGAKAAAMEELNLARLIEEVVQDLHFEESLDIKIQIGELPRVWGNPHLLRKVFANLISNAVKYSDRRDIAITIQARRTVERSIGHFCEFSIQDNGPGVAKEDQKELFNMFRRGRNAEKKCEGVGIGLSVVKRIVELHYGQVGIESEPGQGACFLLSLPIEEIELG